MIPELGNFALILALCLACLLASVPLAGSFTGRGHWMALARPVALMHAGFVLLAYVCLTTSFLSDDFSVAYVANTSNSSLPLMYKVSGVWGGHEGSVLFWVVILAVWTGAVALFGRQVARPLFVRVLAVLGMISIGFILFVLVTSNPFERLFPVPADGASLNPLLQDPGMAFHPPMLYMGYVGFAVAFAFAIAALIGGQLDSATLRWMRPWTLVAWVFLTLGISLGSFWAYYELGWGGWWFWDPVENASFMPWLVGTALLHSLAASEKRGVFKAWTVLLAVLAFSLSLLGTFLVRSGVLTSVHAFATDPTRGLFILLFLGVVVGGSLALYAARASALKGSGGYALVSRESGILLNNVLLVVACAAVLLGTLYPLFLDALGLGKISVGAQYFNAVFVPLMLPIVLLLSVGAQLNWKRDDLATRGLPYAVIAAASLVLAALAVVSFQRFSIAATLALALALWVVGGTLHGFWTRIRHRPKKLGALAGTPGWYWGMSLAHVGIAVFTVGVAMVSIYSEAHNVRMAPGDTYEAGGYTFRFDGVREVRGPNYSAGRGLVEVSRDGRPVADLAAEKRVYDVRRETMTEAAIDASATRDLFVALGEPLDDGAWAVRLQVKPYIRWIWVGTLIMALGGIVAACDRRYRSRERARATLPSTGHRLAAGV